MNNIYIYGFYKNIRNASWQALLDFGCDRLPIGLSSICDQLGIVLLDNTTAQELRPTESGVAVKQDSVWYIVFDDTDVRGKQRFTIAHELGHILLGHALKNGYYTRKSNIAKPEDETAADMFAARLLAPACVLWGLGVTSAEQVAAVCDISITAARIRAERLDLLRQRNKFLTSPIEREVYKQFENYITTNRL